MIADRARIERMVPHAGAMCLIDAVTQWDASHIECVCAGPTTAHPLARDGRLPAIAAAEYAAQATAVHGALLNDQQPRAGMLAKLAGVDVGVPCFPVGATVITVRADLVGRIDAGCLYAFQVSADSQPIARGRLMVAFANASAP
jgi:predicted hotdog family 3-hydroxylacyl-ACP dehydratase